VNLFVGREQHAGDQAFVADLGGDLLQRFKGAFGEVGPVGVAGPGGFDVDFKGHGSALSSRQD